MVSAGYTSSPTVDFMAVLESDSATTWLKDTTINLVDSGDQTSMSRHSFHPPWELVSRHGLHYAYSKPFVEREVSRIIFSRANLRESRNSDLAVGTYAGF